MDKLYLLLIFAIQLFGAHCFVQSNNVLHMSIDSNTQDRRAFLKAGALTLSSSFIVSNFQPSNAEELKYLSEPTKEFLELEAKSAAFRKEQAAYFKVWAEKFTEFEAASTDEAAIAALNNLSRLVYEREGLPASVKKDTLLKVFRKKKSDFKQRGKWGTPTEIAYERLIGEIDRSRKPVNKDIENPL